MKKQKLLSLLLTPLFLLGVTFIHPLLVSAATITVTAGTVDETDNGNCSLYEAVEAANTNSTVDQCTGSAGLDTISIPDGTYNLATTSNNLVLDSDVSLVGASRSGTILNGGDTYGLTANSGSISLSSLTVEHSLGLYGNSSTISSITIDGTIWQDNSTNSASQRSGIDITRSSGPAGTFTMSDSLVRNNSADDGGGVILRGFSEATLENVEAFGNTETSEHQGSVVDIRANAITISGGNFHDNTKLSALGAYGESITIRNTVARNNNGDRGIGLGGGISISTSDGQVANRSATLENVAVVSNQGAFALMTANDQSGFELDAKNVTIANNESSYPALFIYTGGTETPLAGEVTNITIANNTRTGEIGLPSSELPASFMIGSPGGVEPTMQFKNVLLANNLDETTPRNCISAAAPVYNPVSAGNNLSSDATCSEFMSQTTDQNNKDPELDDLTQDGDTWVVPLKSGSPAINTGGTVAGITTDQRGVTRPQGNTYDIGAYEFNGASSPSTKPITKSNSEGTLANTGVIAISTSILGVVILLAIALIYRDYLRHRKPLQNIDPDVRYTFAHHVKIVTLPLLKYRLQIKITRQTTAEGVRRF